MRLLVIGHFLWLGLVAGYSQANTLKPFTTDGCSLWVDGTLAQPYLWRHCCVAHDKAYWLGGSADQRRQADAQIQACVNTAQGPGMANYIHANVRWGGSPYWLSPYRWGYGWNYWEMFAPRGYKEPSEQEQQQILALLPAAEALILRDAALHNSPANSIDKAEK